MKPAELLRATLLALPALLGVALLALLSDLDIAQPTNQRALVLALLATLLSALGLNRWMLGRVRAEQERELKRRLPITDPATGLGNREGLEKALGADIRGVCTLVELRPGLEGPPSDFARLMRRATREEQDELFHDEGRFWALLHETTPEDAEVVPGRIRGGFSGPLEVGKARRVPGAPVLSWLERAEPS